MLCLGSSRWHSHIPMYSKPPTVNPIKSQIHTILGYCITSGHLNSIPKFCSNFQFLIASSGGQFGVFFRSAVSLLVFSSSSSEYFHGFRTCPILVPSHWCRHTVWSSDGVTEHFTLGLVFHSSLCAGSNKSCLVWVEPDLGLIIGPKSHHLRLLGSFERLPSSVSPWNNTLKWPWRSLLSCNKLHKADEVCMEKNGENLDISFAQKQAGVENGWMADSGTLHDSVVWFFSCLIFCCIKGIQSERCWPLNPLEPEKSMNWFQKRGQSYWRSVSVSYWVTVGPRHMKNYFQLQSVRHFVIRWLIQSCPMIWVFLITQRTQRVDAIELSMRL